MKPNSGNGSTTNAAQDSSSSGLRPTRSDTAPNSGISSISATTPMVFDHNDCAGVSSACNRVNVGMSDQENINATVQWMVKPNARIASRSRSPRLARPAFSAARYAGVSSTLRRR